MKDKNINEKLMEIMTDRHSVRQFEDKPIEDQAKQKIIDFCNKITSESGLDFQPIFDEPKCFNCTAAKLCKFKNCTNYIAIVGPKNSNTEIAAGFFGEQLVLFAQEIGLNTCWAALTRKKAKAKVPADQQVIIVIALGYGQTEGVPHVSKMVEDVSNFKPRQNMPAWFEAGVEAACLAPTAINQQRFYFEYSAQEDNPEECTVNVEAKMGPCNRIDLGIVQYHFEAVTGHKAHNPEIEFHLPDAK